MTFRFAAITLEDGSGIRAREVHLHSSKGKVVVETGAVVNTTAMGWCGHEQLSDESMRVALTRASMTRDTEEAAASAATTQCSRGRATRTATASMCCGR